MEDDIAELTPSEAPVPQENDDPLVGITLQSLIGFTYPKTMKFEGEISGKRVLVLLDSEATNNYISTSFAVELGLEISNCG